MSPDPDPRWLLLVHQLPSEPSRLRVRVWRRLQAVGAVAIKGSIYVLPHTAESREDFEWIRSEIDASGGESLVFTADAVDDACTDEIVAAFRSARAADWKELAERARSLERTREAEVDDPTGLGGFSSSVRRELRALEGRAAQIGRIDFFDAPGREAAFDAIERASAISPSAGAGSPEQPVLDPEAFRARQWLTRPRPGVDRMASAWLIRRFIDPEARFSFATQIPEEGDAVAFDMYGAQLGHRGASCTFETITDSFGLDDPALQVIARIVHVLDLREEVVDDAEAATVGRLVEGLRAVTTADAELLERGIQVFEALYASFRRDGTSDRTGRPGRPR